LADAIEGLVTSAEKACKSRDVVQSLRQLVTECKDVFRLKLGARPSERRHDEMGSRVVAGREHNEHGKMASLFAQPYISPPYYDTVEFPSKKEILLVQQNAFNEYERCQQSNAAACQEVSPQQVNAGGMRMMNNALWIPERAGELQLRLCVEAHCRSARHRA
jgi:hypothetical protein